MTYKGQNVVEVLENGLILVQKVGNQTSDTLSELYEQVSSLAKEFRSKDERVLILLDSTSEGDTDLNGWIVADKIGHQLDYDKSASFGTSPSLRVRRQYITNETDISQKVADFSTRAEAERWLLG